MTPTNIPDTHEQDHDGIRLLTIPTDGLAADDTAADDAVMAQAQAWIGDTDGAPLLMTLAGARVLWTRDRIAVMASRDRLDLLVTSLVETTRVERELHAIEREIAESWPNIEQDAPRACDFSQADLPERERLATRFQRTLLLHGRLARISPQVNCPHVHPPTLSSQIAERLRERTRMEYRHEVATEQVEVFERLYESASQRVNDFVHASKGHTLEWIIIILLLIQVVLYGLEILNSYPA